jgi:uncharacterized protein YukE
MSSTYKEVESFFQTNERLLDSLHTSLNKVKEQMNTVDEISLNANHILFQEQSRQLKYNLSELHRLREELAHQQARLEDQIVVLERQQARLQQQLNRLH